MPNYSMAEIVNDPDFAQFLPGAIARDAGQFVLGKWKSSTTFVDFFGIVEPAKSKDVDQVPEGDRIEGAIAFYSSSPLYETHAGQTNVPDGISDVITWHNQPYRLLKVFPWSDFGYYKAIGVRMSGK